MTDRRVKAIDGLLAFYETHGWARGTLARNAQRKRVPSNSPNAVNFCFMGAASRAEIPLSDLCGAFEDTGFGEVDIMNDGRGTKASAMKLLRTVREKLVTA